MKKRVSSAIVMACALGWVAPASAARDPGRAPSDGRLERASGGVARDARDAKFQPAPARRRTAWARFEAEVGPLSATWDAATEVPHRLLLSGVPAPGAMTDPAAAEAFARDLLSRHLDLLAPGASVSDFVLVANDLSAGIRSIGFVQHHHGMPVLGGQVSFRFKHGRLVMIGSGAYPDVAVPIRGRTSTNREVTTRARGWVTSDVSGSLRSTGAIEGPFVLPMVDDHGTVEYREVFRTSVDLDGPPSAWDVYVDAETGAPIARKQTLMFGTGQLLLDVPERSPQGPRMQQPADRMLAVSGGEGTFTSAAGAFDFPGASATIETTTLGLDAEVFNEAGPSISVELPINDGGAAVWQDLTEQGDAQLTAYAHTMVVKNFVRTLSDVPWLDDPIPVNVNIDDTCNAFSDGNSINFFLRGNGCENTALLADVVYHEFGHSIHSQSIIPGVGEFNGALSEGISDFLSSTLTNDSGLGRGFFLDDEPLREFDPDGFEYRWPEDRGPVHGEGRIIGGALWDLRKRMIEKLGPAEGIAYVDRVWYETTRRAVDIPSMYPEALLLDDDDGNLLNGTPNACDINAAYGPHGLFNPGPAGERVTIEATGVSLELSLPNFPDCPVASSPSVRFRRQGTADEDTVEMQLAGTNRYTASLPFVEPNTVLELQVLPGYDIDPARTLPDNIADPWYEFYVGEVIELGCLDAGSVFEADPGWQVGSWAPDSAASDPEEAFDSTDHIWQIGSYPRVSANEISFEAIDTGPYTNVRLQFQRHLAVEDGFYDQAYIQINGENLWENFAADEDFLATFHHVDKEWRFVDFDISEFVGPDGVALTFGTRADGGLEFGGWTLADVCVVALDQPLPTCGNGVVEGPETCDDGNEAPGDGCDATCQVEPDAPDPDDPDNPTDGEPTDGAPTDGAPTDGDDPDGAGDHGLDDDGLIDRGCGCTSEGNTGQQSAVLFLLLAGLRRRREP